ncbi:MAG: HD domain-containing phosphohydrolase [Rectinemataceae bacterium]
MQALQVVLSLLGNINLLIALGAVFLIIRHRFTSANLAEELLYGLYWGSGAVLAMMTPFRYAPGIFYDTRTILVGLGTFFTGPVAGAVSLVMTMAFRVILGGEGWPAGVLSIAVAYGCAAAAWQLKHLFPKSYDKAGRFFRYWLLGLTIHVGVLLSQFALPHQQWKAAIPLLALTYLVLFPLLFALVSLLFESSEELARLILIKKAADAIPVPLVLLDNQGIIEEANNAYVKLIDRTKPAILSTMLTDTHGCMDEEHLRHALREASATGMHVCESIVRHGNAQPYYEQRRIVALGRDLQGKAQYVMISLDRTDRKLHQIRLEIDAMILPILERARTLEQMLQESQPVLKSLFPVQRIGFHLSGSSHVSGELWIGDAFEAETDPDIQHYMLDMDESVVCTCMLKWQHDVLPGIDMLLAETLERLEQRASSIRAMDKEDLIIRRMSVIDILKSTVAGDQRAELQLARILPPIRQLLHADAVSLYLVEKDGYMACTFHEGFFTDLIQGARIAPGQKFVGTALLERRTIVVPLLVDSSLTDGFRKLVTEEGFVSQCCIPVLVDEEPVAVLELFFRKAVNEDSTWLQFAEAAAYQIGATMETRNAIQHAEKMTEKLMEANESIIAGLSSALEFRDTLTRGHTLRVTNLFINFIARYIDAPDTLRKLRYGALLHDIGKIGIPDSVLNKPGLLSEEEMAIMKQHPLIAKDMLSGIPLLSDCMDIPVYHHERYDGSGYPYGLKGEEIPLAARYFAIIDVYDALTSDRPYRRALTKEQAVEQIRSMAGTHFDPELARRFLSDFLPLLG